MSKHAKIESDDDLTTDIRQPPLRSTLITPEAAIPLDLPAQPADLPVTDDVAIVGGGDGGSYGGSIRLNHNEPVVADTDEI